MRRLCLIFLVLLGWPADFRADTLTVRYLANEGVMIEAGAEKIIIDGMYREGVAGYALLPEETRTALESAQPPFNNVSLILVTHRHADHFDARSVAAHLGHNPAAQVLAGEEVAAAILRELSGTEHSASSVVGIAPPWKTARRFQWGGVDVEALRMRHGWHKNYQLHHLGFLLTVGGMRFLHIGDAEMIPENFSPFHLAEADIDVAFIPEWFLTAAEGRAIVDRWIRPRRIVAIHVRPREHKPIGAAVRSAYPNAIVFEQPGQLLSLPPPRILEKN